MITSDGKLKVFEEFRVDRSLPKFAEKETKSANVFTGGSSVVMMDDDSRDGIRTARTFVMRKYADAIPGRPGFWVRLWRAMFPERTALPPAPTVSVLEFFASVKNSAKELEVVARRASGYESAMMAARRTGQRALLEQLESGLAAHRAEAQMAAVGLRKYISEEDVVRFYKASERGLRLDWVANFTRQVPDEVAWKKAEADGLGVFDNYAVMHYDPGAKSFAETEAEREKRRDPILFGLVRGKRVLYFVGDWVDEVCDLTLDQIADKLGADAVQETGDF